MATTMFTGKITAGGRITIPAAVRREFDLNWGDWAIIEVDDDGTITISKEPPVEKRRRRTSARLPG